MNYLEVKKMNLMDGNYSLTMLKIVLSIEDFKIILNLYSKRIVYKEKKNYYLI